eukprot:symbB.v1.2.007905.t1/scaffold491.1/size196728/9
MAIKALHDGYQKIPVDDKDFFVQSDEETDCNSGWGSERYSQDRFLSEELMKADEDEEEELLTPLEKKSCFCFVETWWFHIIATLVIGANTVTIVLEADSPAMVKKFSWFEQGFLCFYCIELTCRASLWKRKFLCGPRRLVMWSLLDLMIVSAGVVDQWALVYVEAMLPERVSHKLAKFLSIMRLLRLLRVLKVLGFVLEWDLSWTDRPAFQSFIGGVIAVNALLMGCETDIDWGGWLVIENVLLCIYVFELVVRLKRLGRDFFSCESPDLVWNLLDLVIVVSSAGDSWLMPLANVCKKSLQGHQVGEAKNEKAASGVNVGQLMMLMRLLRLLRILRLAKLVKSVRPLYILVVSVTAAVQGVVWVLVLTVVTLYAMGILTTRLIGHKMLFDASDTTDDSLTAPFRTVPDSMFTLFRVMSGAQSDAEAAALDSIMDDIPTFKFAFVFFMVTSSWTLLSILTAVVSENMISTTSGQEKEILLMSEEEDRKRHVQDLKELFKEINSTGDGIVRERDLIRFLQNPNNAQQTSKMCRVPVRHVQEVMKTLAINSEMIRMEQFVECLLDVGNPVTEKSTMRLEALHLETRTQSAQYLESLEERVEELKHYVQFAHESSQVTSQSDPSHPGDLQRLQSSIDALHGKLDHLAAREAAMVHLQGLPRPKSTRRMRVFLKSLGVITTKEAVVEMLQAGGLHHSHCDSMEELWRVVAAHRACEGFTYEELDRAKEEHDKMSKETPSRFFDGQIVCEALLSLETVYSAEYLNGIIADFGEERLQKGPLSFYEFLIMYRRLHYITMKAMADSFDKADSDKDGMVTSNEATDCLRQLGFTLLRAEYLEMLELIGAEKEERLHFDAVYALLVEARNQHGFTRAEAEDLKVHFDAFCDADGEMPNLQMYDLLRYIGHESSLDEVKELLDQVDYNHNDTMDRREYLRLMRLQKEANLTGYRNAWCSSKMRCGRKVAVATLGPTMQAAE